MAIPRGLEGEFRPAHRRPQAPPEERYLVPAVLVFVLVLLFAGLTSGDGRHELTVYTGTSFAGDEVRLEDTSGTCQPVNLREPARSVRNHIDDMHATLFSDTQCTNPVTVVSSGEGDSGFVPGDSRAAQLGQPYRTLLGKVGARSYQTTSRP